MLQSHAIWIKECRGYIARLMNKVFVYQIGCNIKVYIDDMVAKTLENGDHCSNLAKIFKKIRRHNVRLNLEKCIFGVQAEKFLKFMLTNQGIEADLDKSKAILEMRSPSNVKKV